MRRLILPLLLLALALAALVFMRLGRSGLPTGYPAPDFTLPSLDGKQVTLSDLRGKVVFLNLWATWCPPCRMEMPSMEMLHRRLKDRNFVMLTVNEDGDDMAAVAPFARKLGLTFTVLLDRLGTLPGRYGVTGFPETFIIDTDGQILHHEIGPADWASDARVTYFLDLLATKDAGASSQR